MKRFLRRDSDVNAVNIVKAVNIEKNVVPTKLAAKK
jgi:hypothetical protein